MIEISVRLTGSEDVFGHFSQRNPNLGDGLPRSKVLQHLSRHDVTTRDKVKEDERGRKRTKEDKGCSCALCFGPSQGEFVGWSN